MELEPLSGICRVRHTQYLDTLQTTMNKTSIDTDLIRPAYVLGIRRSEPAGFQNIASISAELRFGCDCEIEALARTKHVGRTDKLREMR